MTMQPHALRAFVALILLGACAPNPTERASAVPTLEADAWVEQTLASLSLREKVGQLMIPWLTGSYVAVDSPEFDRIAEWVERDGVGGLIFSFGMPHSFAAKANAAQRRARVPLLISADLESGPGHRMSGIYSFPHLFPQGGATDFPPVMALGATGSDSLAYEVGRVLGREARAVGVHVTFGPVLDVNSNPLNPIINTRSFGEDPALVARLAAAYIRGARDAGLMTTGKHFPGHGDTEADSHIELPVIRGDRERLQAVELYPFRRAVEAGIDGVMTAHIAVVGVEGEDASPATLSPYFMTTVLREQLGFDGLLFTDAMDMGGVLNRYGTAESLIRALEAGADVLLMPVDVREAIETVLGAVASGRLTEARLDASVRRILEAKARLRLHRDRLVDLDAVDRVVGTRAHTELAAAVASRAITLARDDRALVPLPGAAQNVLLLSYARANDPISGTVFEAALRASGREVTRARIDARTTPAEFAALERRAADADVVVVAAFVSPHEGTGSVGTAGGFAGFVQRLAAAGAPVVVVSFGSPYLLAAFPDVPAYMLAWGGADASQRAAADALLGSAAITGTLPISLPPHFARGDGIQRAAALAALATGDP